MQAGGLRSLPRSGTAAYLEDRSSGAGDGEGALSTAVGVLSESAPVENDTETLWGLRGGLL